MNIFVLSENPAKAAKMHCDKHVVKMLLETTQLLCSAYYYTGQEELSPYKLAHKNHPCSIWVRESLENWLWLQQLGIELYKEYKYRYGLNKTHKSGEILLTLLPPLLPCKGITKRPQCMELEFKDLDCVTAYRNYYKYKQQTIQFKYTKRKIPEWLVEFEPVIDDLPFTDI